MKIEISYFYNIRYFTLNRIPMSTCISDPAWYHDFKDKTHLFIDKRGVLNGLRLLPTIVQGWDCDCPCEAKDPTVCTFLKNYRIALDSINFEEMYDGIKSFANRYQREHNIKDEMIMTLIVYEPPKKLCSERGALIDYFAAHGIEVKEFNPKEIK